MGWGEEFNTTVYISRVAVGSVEEAKGMIDNEIETINSFKTQIKMYASANPNDIVPKDWEEDKISFMAQEIDRCFEVISESERLICKLELYIDKYEIYDKLEENKGN